MKLNIIFAAGSLFLAAFFHTTGSWIWEQLLEHVVTPKNISNLLRVSIRKILSKPNQLASNNSGDFDIVHSNCLEEGI